jgi:hypothetical protein
MAVPRSTWLSASGSPRWCRQSGQAGRSRRLRLLAVGQDRRCTSLVRLVSLAGRQALRAETAPAGFFTAPGASGRTCAARRSAEIFSSSCLIASRSPSKARCSRSLAAFYPAGGTYRRDEPFSFGRLVLRCLALMLMTPRCFGGYTKQEAKAAHVQDLPTRGCGRRGRRP